MTSTFYSGTDSLTVIQYTRPPETSQRRWTSSLRAKFIINFTLLLLLLMLLLLLLFLSSVPLSAWDCRLTPDCFIWQR